MSRPNLSRIDRIAEMSKQEQLIARKRLEILEKQKTAELAKAVAAAQSEVSGKLPNIEESTCSNASNKLVQPVNDLRPKVQNTFCNDGSFLTHFKKILESTKEKEKKIEKTEGDISDNNSQSKLEVDDTSDAPENISNSSPPPCQIESNYGSDSDISFSQRTYSSDNNEKSPKNISENENIQRDSTQSYSECNKPTANLMGQYNSGVGEQSSSTTVAPTTICNMNIPPPNIAAPPPPPSQQQQQLQQQNRPPFFQQSLYYNPNIPPPIISPTSVPNPPPPPPPPSSCLPIYMIPPPEPLQLNNIPPPKELDLNAIPPPEMSLESIKVPELDKQLQDNNEQFLPTTLESLIELVAENGDAYEDKIRTQKNELQPSLWFLFNKDSSAYNDYRRQIMEYRNRKHQAIINDGNGINIERQPENENKLESNDEKYDPESVISQDYQEDSDDEYMKDMKERNLGNLKRKLEELSEQSQESDDDDYDDNEDTNKERRAALHMAKTMAATFSSSSNSSTTTSQQTQQQIRQQRKRKSRWGGKVDPSSQVITAMVQTNFANQNKPMLSAIQRTDPALLQYARQNYGTINLSEEDWRKCEDHFKVNLLYQDMMRKRREIDMLAKSGKFKYEYDSDEDTTGGTWEHKLRTAEMEATKAWADALTQQSEGKHHIGDFLPPEELKKFMEKYEAKKSNRQPDLSDYKEYKLREDNIGFQMLQKLGWKEGQGLGASGEGIVDPINKAPQRDANQGLGAGSVSTPDDCDNEYDAYRKRMMLAYRFRPNPLNNPRRAYY